MTKGTLKWLYAAKVFGYIPPDGSDKDVFVHQTALQVARTNRLAEGQDAKFDVSADGDGRHFLANMSLA